MTTSSLDAILEEQQSIEAEKTFKEKANERDPHLYRQASQDRLQFWEEQAKSLHWDKTWDQVLSWNRPYAKWFLNGKLNASVNCLDIHKNTPVWQKTALLWESEEGQVRSLTYESLYEQVNRVASALKNKLHLKKGDRVTLYMPMIPELVVSVLACSRIGVIHSVVFAGFSVQSLKDRIIDSGSTVVITADGGYRRGAVIPCRDIVREALKDGDTDVKYTLTKRYITRQLSLDDNEHDYDQIVNQAEAYQAPESMDSEDTLFILYTSGTTGKPKGIIHSTGGYMTHAKYSTKLVFDLKDEDIYWCTADIGWITGHTYVTYGPLSNGATVFLYEGTPDYPQKNRFWELIEKHQISILYTAPTAIRAFMKWGETHITQHKLDSLRLLGTVGEPINPEAWLWYHDIIGQKRCPIVDTWWQTETGGIMISTLPALKPMKPGYAGQPLPGIEAKVLDENQQVVTHGAGLLSLTEPWPSMLRGIWGDSKRYEETYWSKFESYFAGDGAKVHDKDYFMVTGRVDDVLNVAGHRIGTMEVESLLVDYPDIAEAAVVGMPDEIKGQAIVGYVILKESCQVTDETEAEVKAFIAKKIGAIARPKHIVIVPDLPKTRSGKIMRRLLKAIANSEQLGDTTTLGNPGCLDAIQELWENR